MDRILAFLIALICPCFIGEILGSLAGPVLGSVFGSDSPSGGGASGGGAQYVPTGLGLADSGWQQAYGQQGLLANQAYNTALPGYQQSLNQNNGINYSNYLLGSRTAGDLSSANLPTYYNQANQFANGANSAQAQQQALYGAGNSLWQSANDPQQALYGRTQQQLMDQVRAGQAARGLGNSAVGAGLEDQANSNFNIDWQNQQLARQLQGAQGLAGLSNAGGVQGQLMGADLTAQGNALQSGIQAYQGGYQIPYAGQQYVAQQPGAAAQTYASQLGGLQSLYGNYQGAAIPYMNSGQGAQQGNYTANAAQNAQLSTGLGQLGTAAVKSYNTPGSWLNNAFGGGGTSSGAGAGNSSDDWWSTIYGG